MELQLNPENEIQKNLKNKWIELIIYFFRLGLVGFGGPLALIADMQSELVEKRKWISSQEFRQAFAAIKSMPGPVAYQVAQYLGTRYIGRLAGIVAGIVLLLPAIVMVILLASSYSAIQSSPSLRLWMLGFQAGALLLIAQALGPLSRGYRDSYRFWLMIFFSITIFYFDIASEPILIFLGGSLFIFHSLVSSYIKKSKHKIQESAFSLMLLLWICFKAGAVVFGTGLAIVPLLENDFVRDLHWLTHQEFMDALAIGQLTPGPVTVTVTFIGYKLGGLPVAILATIAIFLPSTLHQATWFPSFVGWFSKQKWIHDFVEGATAVILAGIIWSVGRLFLGLLQVQQILFFCLFALSFLLKRPSWFWILLPGAILYLIGS